jgi:glycosyltransferase involved in cell wall biosynthesis
MTPLVSVITIFLNEERFLDDAVHSILAQTYPHWELLLVDDGSTDGSSARARVHAARSPDRVRYLEHPGHANRGMSATRNLGLEHARGEYVAFLDADDVWLPDKLAQQVAALEAQPEAAMVYGPSLFWHSWTGRPEDAALDGISRTAGRAGELTSGVTVLERIIRRRRDAIATCSALLRRSAVMEVGGFEPRFSGLFEDQAFFAKLLLRHDLLVMGECLDLYRQHGDSCCARASQSREAANRLYLDYLAWLGAYAGDRENAAGIRRAVRLERLLHRSVLLVDARARAVSAGRALGGRLAKSALSLGAALLPKRARRWLWARGGFEREKAVVQGRLRAQEVRRSTH